MSGSITTNTHSSKGGYFARSRVGRLLESNLEGVKKLKPQSSPPAEYSKPYHNQISQKTKNSSLHQAVLIDPEIDKFLHPGAPSRPNILYHEKLQEFCRNGISAERLALSCYTDEFWQLSAVCRTKEEQEEGITKAGAKLKARLKKILDEQTDEAIKYITLLPEYHQRPAKEYWTTVSEQLQDFVEASLRTCTKAIKDMEPILGQLWAANQELESDMDEIYDTANMIIKSF